MIDPSIVYKEYTRSVYPPFDNMQLYLPDIEDNPLFQMCRDTKTIQIADLESILDITSTHSIQGKKIYLIPRNISGFDEFDRLELMGILSCFPHVMYQNGGYSFEYDPSIHNQLITEILSCAFATRWPELIPGYIDCARMEYWSVVLRIIKRLDTDRELSLCQHPMNLIALAGHAEWRDLLHPNRLWKRSMDAISRNRGVISELHLTPLSRYLISRRIDLCDDLAYRSRIFHHEKPPSPQLFSYLERNHGYRVIKTTDPQFIFGTDGNAPIGMPSYYTVNRNMRLSIQDSDREVLGTVAIDPQWVDGFRTYSRL